MPGTDQERRGRSQPGVADGVWDIEVQRSYVVRDTEHTGWHLRVGARWYHFWLKEETEQVDGRWRVTHLRMSRFAELRQTREGTLEESAALGPASDFALQRLVAAEAVLTRYTREDRQGPQVTLSALGRSWTLADLVVADRDLATPPLSGVSVWRALRARPISEAAKQALIASERGPLRGPNDECDAATFRGFGPLPGVGADRAAGSADLRLGGSFSGPGGFARLNDIVVRGPHEPRSMSDRPLPEVVSLTGRALSPREVTDSVTLRDDVFELIARRGSHRRWSRNRRFDNWHASQTLVVGLATRNRAMALGAALAMADHDQQGGLQTAIMLGCGAGLRGRAPLGWLPLFVVMMRGSLNTDTGEPLVVPQSPNWQFLVQAWWNHLSTDATQPPLAQAGGLAIERYLEGLFQPEE